MSTKRAYTQAEAIKSPNSTIGWFIRQGAEIVVQNLTEDQARYICHWYNSSTVAEVQPGDGSHPSRE